MTGPARLIYLHVDAQREKGPGIIGLDKNPFTDPRVRKALSLAIDRDSIVKMIMNGNAYATNQMVLKGRRGYVEDMPEAKYDPEQAKKLVAEAATPTASRSTSTPPTAATPTTRPGGQAVASQLTKAGILVELRLHPKTTFFDFARPATSPALL